MTNVLTVDCSADELIVCAVYDGVYAESRSGGAQRHNGAVLGCVDKVMTALGAKPSDFDAFAAVVGPGSFTGIRIGVATIKTLSLATGKPSVLIPSPNVAENHQYHNAMALVRNDAARLIAEKDLTPESLTALVESLLADRAQLRAIGENARKMAVLDSAKVICEHIVRLAKGAD